MRRPLFGEGAFSFEEKTMNNSVSSRKNAARVERQQRKRDAGLVAVRFPEVERIVVSMMYHQKGIQQSLPRIVNFFPDSYAVFRIDCLNKECFDGGFDLSGIITGMVRNRRKTAHGDMDCDGDSASVRHSTIAYDITVHYS